MPSPTSVKKLSQKALSDELRRLALQVTDVDDEGEAVTRAQKLARAVWDRALGFEESREDGKKVPHPPETWAMQYVFERLEGKVQTQATEETTRIKASERVAEMAKDRINELTKEIAS